MYPEDGMQTIKINECEYFYFKSIFGHSTDLHNKFLSYFKHTVDIHSHASYFIWYKENDNLCSIALIL
jgi:hypothetical protein